MEEALVSFDSFPTIFLPRRKSGLTLSASAGEAFLCPTLTRRGKWHANEPEIETAAAEVSKDEFLAIARRSSGEIKALRAQIAFVAPTGDQADLMKTTIKIVRDSAKA